ncbi:MAG TPA: ABC transporter permease [Methylomirabilota bacterium]|jgi:peptide/nickel transport system permease protein|nr:ABC transporter permease [Methylomirabilota bacterium]
MSDAWGRFLKHRLALAGLGLILALILIALSARQVAPHDPLRQDLPHALAGPSIEFPLGTDEFGRCILSRILFGARLSLLVGVIATAIGATAGILSGLAAGYFPRLDAPVMRTMDVLLAFPSILLAIAVVAALGPSLGNVMIAVGVRSIPSFARLARSMVLSLKELDFVQGAAALGASHARVLFRHILPNSVSPLLVFSSMQVATAILLAAILSFLGLGVQPPTPEWGKMVSDGRAYLLEAPHVSLFPGLAIFIAVMGFNCLGDGLRDALDPRVGRVAVE